MMEVKYFKLDERKEGKNEDRGNGKGALSLYLTVPRCHHSVTEPLRVTERLLIRVDVVCRARPV